MLIFSFFPIIKVFVLFFLYKTEKKEKIKNHKMKNKIACRKKMFFFDFYFFIFIFFCKNDFWGGRVSCAPYVKKNGKKIIQIK